METFSVHRNQLTELPKELSGMVGLARLSLYENQLAQLPEQMGAMSTLQEL